MHEAVLREIQKRLNLLFETDTDFFVKLLASKDFAAYPVTQESFSTILQAEAKPELSFIDGGNNTLFASTVFLLSAIRICAYTSAKNKVVHTFFLIVQKQKTHFELSFIPSDVGSEQFLEIISIPAQIANNDADFLKQAGKIDLQQIVSFVRRLLELQLAKEFDAVVLDGSLESKHVVESEILQSYFASKKTIIGLSKTTAITTENGIPATLYLNRLSPFTQPWYTCSILVKREFEICFTKLAEKSTHVFRVDVPCYEDKNTVFSQLKTRADDVTFLGYPYGLVKADEFARISEDELQFFRNRFFDSLDSLTRTQLEQIRTTKSAHSVLDTMKF